MKDILDNTLCFTHGGNWGALQGILATGKLSSTQALLSQGDNAHKFTDPNNEFKEENNCLFFESFADRGRLNYASLVAPQKNQAGFSFLLVTSSDSLLNQVDSIGCSDGILMTRLDGQDFEVDLKQVTHKLLIPQEYQLEVEKYTKNLIELGLKPLGQEIIYKPLSEIQELLNQPYNENKLKPQQEFCEKIGLNAQVSSKEFNFSSSNINTKTDKVELSCSTPLEPSVESKKYNILSSEGLLSHMKERPTTANIQRDSLLLFSEISLLKSDLKESLKNTFNGKPPVAELLNRPEDLALCLNNLAKTHPYSEINDNGQRRIDPLEAIRIGKKIAKHIEPHLSEGIVDCLRLVAQRDITAKDCENLLKPKNIEILEEKWHVAINREVHPTPYNTDTVKQFMSNSNGQEILLWKEGMAEWKNSKEIYPEVTIKPSVPELPPLPISDPSNVINNMQRLREQSFVNSNKSTLKNN